LLRHAGKREQHGQIDGFYDARMLQRRKKSKIVRIRGKIFPFVLCAKFL
jgi:hypothetical protein